LPETLAVLSEVMRDFPQPLKANDRIIPWLCHYISFLPFFL
jgi:hypothetical protein